MLSVWVCGCAYIYIYIYILYSNSEVYRSPWWSKYREVDLLKDYLFHLFMGLNSKRRTGRLRPWPRPLRVMAHRSPTFLALTAQDHQQEPKDRHKSDQGQAKTAFKPESDRRLGVACIIKTVSVRISIKRHCFERCIQKHTAPQYDKQN